MLGPAVSRRGRGRDEQTHRVRSSNSAECASFHTVQVKDAAKLCSMGQVHVTALGLRNETITVCAQTANVWRASSEMKRSCAAHVAAADADSCAAPGSWEACATVELQPISSRGKLGACRLLWGMPSRGPAEQFFSACRCFEAETLPSLSIFFFFCFAFIDICWHFGPNAFTMCPCSSVVCP